ncbi:MAG: hypothetical protein E5V24_09660 [Mesorhizobium sp.]|nr:MAG: hypothetical protein E5V24_09660 [Mesorhizobium sp.]
MTMRQTIARLALVATAGLVLASCQLKPKSAPAPSGKSAALLAMEQMANELNSFTGTPRFLLVPVKHYGAKPLLVVQAQGNSRRIDVYGPLMNEPLGARIGSDIARWQTGNPACGAAA